MTLHVQLVPHLFDQLVNPGYYNIQIAAIQSVYSSDNRHHASPNNIAEFCPPKPAERDMAAFTRLVLNTFGT